MYDGLVQQLREAIGENRYLGEYKQMYLVNDTTVGKGYYQSWVPKRNRRKRAKNDFRIGRMLHEGGVSVPEMYLLKAPDFHPFRRFKTIPIEHWYLLMEKIYGEEIHNLKGSELEEAARQCKVELEKAINLNVFPGGLHGANVLFNRNEGKAYLIDFEDWIRRKTTDSDHDWLDGLDPATLL